MPVTPHPLHPAVMIISSFVNDRNLAAMVAIESEKPKGGFAFG